MAEINLQNLTPNQYRALADILSTDRLTRYLVASGHDKQRAMRLYLWNSEVGATFYIPTQAVEVGLRNRINHALSAQFGEEWWANRQYISLLDQPRINDLSQVKSRIYSRSLPLTTGQIVAGLSFGFWAGMLHRRYNPDVWTRQLRLSFPYLPDIIDRRKLYDEVRNLVELRNRISHHEPLFRRNLMEDHRRTMQLLGWLCPTKAALLRPYCKAPMVIRQKP